MGTVCCTGGRARIRDIFDTTELSDDETGALVGAQQTERSESKTVGSANPQESPEVSMRLRCQELLDMAETLLRENHEDQAISIAQEAYNSALEIADEALQCKAVHCLGIAKMHIDPQGALSLEQDALKVAQRIGDMEVEVGALGYCGVLKLMSHEHCEGMTYIQKAVDKSRCMDDAAHLLKNLSILANAHDSVGDHLLARTLFEELLQHKRIEEYVDIQAAALWHVASIYKKLGMTSRAIETMQRGVNTTRATGKEDELAEGLSQLACIYAETGRYEDAVEAYLESLIIQRKLRAKNIASTLRELADAQTHLSKGRSGEKAEELLQAAGTNLVEASNYCEDGEVEASINMRLGTVMLASKKPSAALDYYNRALSFYREIKEPSEREAEALLSCASAMSVLDQSQEALHTCEQALRSFDLFWSQLVEDRWRKTFRNTAIAERLSETFQTILLQTGQERKALEIAERFRGRSFIASMKERESEEVGSLDGIFSAARSAGTAAGTFILYYSLLKRTNTVVIWAIRSTGDIRLCRQHQLELEKLGVAEFTQLAERIGSVVGGRDCGGQSLDAAPEQGAGIQRIKNQRAKEFLEACYCAFIAPVIDVIQNEVDLLIVPDGELSLLPWVAMRCPKNGAYLIQSHTVALVPSLASLAFADHAEPEEERTLSLVGYPIFPASVRDRCTELVPLAESQKEFKFVAGACESVGMKVTSCSGVVATKPRVKQQMKCCTHLIHMSTHGLSAGALDSSLLLSGESEAEATLSAHEIYSLRLQARLAFLNTRYSGPRLSGADGPVSWG